MSYHIICYHNIWQPSTFCHFKLSLCGKYILLGGNCLLHTFIFTLTFLLCSYISRMARGDHQDDDDDFMELPRQNRATRRTTDGDEVTVHPPSPLPHMFLNVMLSLQSSDRV